VFRTSADCVGRGLRLSRAVGKAAMRYEALTTLREIPKPGDTVHGIVRSVARSGMSRRIDFYKLLDGDKLYLTADIAAIEGTDNFDGGLLVSGCGMDMIFATVYNLGAALWPKGTPTPHGRRNGEPDSDGGYALKSAQL
jgi:hypothetical protein